MSGKRSEARGRGVGRGARTGSLVEGRVRRRRWRRRTVTAPAEEGERRRTTATRRPDMIANGAIEAERRTRPLKAPLPAADIAMPLQDDTATMTTKRSHSASPRPVGGDTATRKATRIDTVDAGTAHFETTRTT